MLAAALRKYCSKLPNSITLLFAVLLLPASGVLVIFKYRSLVLDMPDVRRVVQSGLREGYCRNSGSNRAVSLCGRTPCGGARGQDHFQFLRTRHNSLMQVRISIMFISTPPIMPVANRASGNAGIEADLIAGVIGLAVLR